MMMERLTRNRSRFQAQLLIAFAAVYLIWGSTYLAIRFAIETLPGYSMSGARFLLAGAGLYAWSRWKGAPRPTRRNWAHAALIGALLFLGGNGSVVWAEQRVPSGLAALLIATEPLGIVLLFSFWRGGHRPTGLRCSASVSASWARRSSAHRPPRSVARRRTSYR